MKIKEKEWAETKTVVCQFCGVEMILQRRGTGNSYHGIIDYWYLTDHKCPKALQDLIKSQRETITNCIRER